MAREAGHPELSRHLETAQEPREGQPAAAPLPGEAAGDRCGPGGRQVLNPAGAGQETAPAATVGTGETRDTGARKMAPHERRWEMDGDDAEISRGMWLV